MDGKREIYCRIQGFRNRSANGRIQPGFEIIDRRDNYVQYETTNAKFLVNRELYRKVKIGYLIFTEGKSTQLVQTRSAKFHSDRLILIFEPRRPSASLQISIFATPRIYPTATYACLPLTTWFWKRNRIHSSTSNISCNSNSSIVPKMYRYSCTIKIDHVCLRRVSTVIFTISISISISIFLEISPILLLSLELSYLFHYILSSKFTNMLTHWQSTTCETFKAWVK